MPSTTVFTKPDCPYCTVAKEALDRCDVDYVEIDVTALPRHANASVYLSGAPTVPQVFLGDVHANGSTDVLALAEAGMLSQLASSADGVLDVDMLTDQALRQGAQDLSLCDLIPESDGTHDDDSETWAILHFYKSFFGFWPNCFYYQHHWPEAYKLFVYCHNVGAIGGGREVLGEPIMLATSFATSNAHGCNYCMVHSTAAGGVKGLGVSTLIENARNGTAPINAPIGPFELALIDIAAGASTNEVGEKDLLQARSTIDAARVTQSSAADNVMATAMIASAFGFLNVFNDLTNVKVEAEWAKKAGESAGIETGRHGVSHDRESNNLDHELPTGGPTMEEMVAKYEGLVAASGGPQAYLEAELGCLPAWIALWPEHLRARHAHFYVEIMQDRDHSLLPSELKHLMARVSAIASGHDYLAAIEAVFAWQAGGSTARSADRARYAFEVAKRREVPDGLFSDRDCAALILAAQSAQTPLTTPHQFVAPAIEAFSSVELVHLVTVCATAGLIGRFVAVVNPKIEPETQDICDQLDFETNTLILRHGLPFMAQSKEVA